MMPTIQMCVVKVRTSDGSRERQTILLCVRNCVSQLQCLGFVLAFFFFIRLWSFGVDVDACPYLYAVGFILITQSLAYIITKLRREGEREIDPVERRDILWIPICDYITQFHSCNNERLTLRAFWHFFRFLHFLFSFFFSSSLFCSTPSEADWLWPADNIVIRNGEMFIFGCQFISNNSTDIGIYTPRSAFSSVSFALLLV